MEFEETRIGRLEHKIEKLKILGERSPGVEFMRSEVFSGDPAAASRRAVVVIDDGVARAHGGNLEPALREELRGIFYARRAPNDAKESTAAFLEKRKPDWAPYPWYF